MTTNTFEQSLLIELATKQYHEYDMDTLPEELQRNSRYFYYLSVYPGLGNMYELTDDKLPRLPNVTANAYIHTPYCTGVCSFCSYFLTTVNSNDSSPIHNYFETVKKEISQRAQETELDISYLYFGGGTPSLIPLKTLDGLFDFLQRNQYIHDELQGTLELHPEFFNDLERAQTFIDILKANGISRVSLGYQSADEEILDDTNRRHNSSFLKDAIAFLKENEMTVNLDLIYGLPDMTLTQWEKTLQEAIGCQPDSVSTYFLFLSPRTAMHSQIRRGIIELPSHKYIQIQHIMARIALESYGLYELPNDFYAKVTDDPRTYTQGTLPSDGASLPLGAGSYGYYDNTQFFNQFSLPDYKERVDAGRSPIWRGYHLQGEDAMRRDVMFSLKNSPHIDRGLFVSKYGIDPVSFFDTIVTQLQEFGMLSFSENEKLLSLTPKGRLCVEEIACMFDIPNLPSQKPASLSRLERHRLEKHHFAPLYNKVVKKL